MIEQQRLGQRLHQIDEIVVTANVRKLVREDRFDLGCVELRQRRDRQHDNRSKAADDERDVNVRKARRYE